MLEYLKNLFPKKQTMPKMPEYMFNALLKAEKLESRDLRAFFKPLLSGSDLARSCIHQPESGGLQIFQGITKPISEETYEKAWSFIAWIYINVFIGDKRDFVEGTGFEELNATTFERPVTAAARAIIGHEPSASKAFKMSLNYIKNFKEDPREADFIIQQVYEECAYILQCRTGVEVLGFVFFNQFFNSTHSFIEKLYNEEFFKKT